MKVSYGGDTWMWDPDTELLVFDYAVSGEVATEAYGKEEAPGQLRNTVLDLQCIAIKLEEMARLIGGEDGA